MKRKGLTLFLVLCISLLQWGTGWSQPTAGTLYAKPTASGGGDCSSWANACTLQTALGMAVVDDEIWAAAGVISSAIDGVGCVDQALVIRTAVP